MGLKARYRRSNKKLIFIFDLTVRFKVAIGHWGTSDSSKFCQFRVLYGGISRIMIGLLCPDLWVSKPVTGGPTKNSFLFSTLRSALKWLLDIGGRPIAQNSANFVFCTVV